MKISKIIVAVVLGMSLMSSFVCNAATTANISVDATVSAILELSFWMRKQTGAGDPYGAGSSDATSMSFGALQVASDNTLFSNDWFAVFLVAATSGRTYAIRQTCTGVTSGLNSLPAAAFTVTPDYQSADEWSPGVSQGAMPTGAALGTAGSAVATDKNIYTSDTAGLSRIIRAYYALPQGTITKDQPSGSYTATVTFTVVLL